MNLPIKFFLLAVCSVFSASVLAKPQQSYNIFSGANDYFSYKVDGKIRLRHEEFDGIYTQNGGDRSDTYLRRADLALSGAIGQRLDYEWAGKINSEHKWTVKTFFLGFAPTGQTYLKLGRHDADFGLEMSSSSTWSLGVERSSIWELSPNAGEAEDGYGFSASHHSLLTRLSLGHFEREDLTQNTLRAVLKPVHKKRHLLHLGYSYADAYDVNTEGRIRTNLGVYAVERHPDGNRTQLAKKVDSGVFNSDKTAVLEFAYLYGPVSLQAERLTRKLGDNNSNNAKPITRQADGNYIQLAYSLTGEARNYDEDQAVFGRLKSRNKKWGAWEIFARTENLKVVGEAGMLSKKRAKSSAKIHTLGVNWYPGDDWRLTLDTRRGECLEVPNDDGITDGAAISMQVLYRFGG
ncbi:MAG TPA: porin [Cellvibrionaceae bacterium]